MRTYYDVLNVSESAPEEVIRAAYRALCLRWHPDRNGNTSESVKAMQLLNQAYAVLIDAERRRDYDAKLGYLRSQDTSHPGGAVAPVGSPRNASRAKASGKRWWQTLFLVPIWDIRLTLLAGILIFVGMGSLLDFLDGGKSPPPRNQAIPTPNPIATSPTPRPTLAEMVALPAPNLDYLYVDPLNGTVFSGLWDRWMPLPMSEGSRNSLEIVNGMSRGAHFKAIDRYGSVACSFFVGANTSVTMYRVADGTYTLLFCTGTAFSFEQKQYTRNKRAMQFDTPVIFSTRKVREGDYVTTYSDQLTITLHAVADGNTTTSEIASSEFDRY